MMLIRTICIILTMATHIVNSESPAVFSAKEKIRIHKEWLERRAKLKMQYSSNNDKSNLHKTNTQNNIISNDVYPEFDSISNTSFLDTKKSIFLMSTTIEPDKMLVSTLSTPFNTESTNTEKISENIDGDISSVTTEVIKSTTAADLYSTESGSVVTTELPSNKTNDGSVTSKPKKRIKMQPHWGPWSGWSDCSRSCGGGVMFQLRRCIARRPSNPSRRYISKACIGLYKRFHPCNEQDCPQPTIDFRQQQCSSFDDTFFQGKKYQWELYIKEDAECQLNCKPFGMKYFATLNHTVIDGTPCFRPAEYYRKNYRGKAICVEGICKAIHASGVITGSFANSGTVLCGGLICRPISGIFSKDPLPSEYTHVATIPGGASNISVTELKNSMNLLVLRSLDKSFVINGDRKPSASGIYEAAGAVFDYRRIDNLGQSHDGKKIEGVTEWLTCTGPTMEPIHLMIFGRETNPGIKYEYLLPIGSYDESEEDILDSNGSYEMDQSGDVDSTVSLKSGDRNYEETSTRPMVRRKRKFIWKIVGFSPCTKSCGGGIQTPIVRCVREMPLRYISARRCEHLNRPVVNENILRCNTQPCPAYWRIEEWGDCQCYDGIGHRERETRCVQELATGIVIQVNGAACLEEAPLSKKSCDCPKMDRRRQPFRSERQRIQAHARGPETVVTNLPYQRRIPQPVKNKKAGMWLMSDWNEHCSVECGTGVEHRSIFCDRSPPNIVRCDPHQTPDSTRTCHNENDCGSGEWFTSSWGQCAGSCFNLTKSREAICIQNQLIVDDDECKIDEKPPTIKNCTLDEVSYCKPRWHYSEWTECTKSCDSGTQRRSVKCLEQDFMQNTLKPSQSCRYSEREPIYRSCNTSACPDPRVELIQNDIASPTNNCEDEFPNCHLFVKARLCNYEYYRTNCCYSCTEKNDF